jgi:rubrerythrin
MEKLVADILELTARMRAHADQGNALLDMGNVFRAGLVAPTPVHRLRGSHATVTGGRPSDDQYKTDLVECLHLAVEIEFATIPLYLTALWSIIDQTHRAARVVRAVVHEEMLHLALLCNLLSALGERPVLTGSKVPTFPSDLPGGVHQDLKLKLLGYGSEALALFMHIERPYKATKIEGEKPETFDRADQTIGKFYESLIDSLGVHKLELDPKWQIAGPFSWLVITNLEDIGTALKLIKDQGEGAAGGLPFSRSERYLSHYYRFKSLALQRELRWDASKNMLVKDGHIPPPPVFTLAPAPSGEYGLAAPRALRKASEKFDATYSQMLRSLEGSWLEGGHKSYLKAIELMFELGMLAQTIMHIGTPDGRGHCPSFRYRP